jgi:toxin ParE1/3/4
MATVRWTPSAARDLEEIFLYIGRDQHSPTAAARVVREIAAQAATYAQQPLLATTRPDIGPSVRAFRVFRYVAFIAPVEDGIEVLPIIHGARDIPSIFARGE